MTGLHVQLLAAAARRQEHALILRLHAEALTAQAPAASPATRRRVLMFVVLILVMSRRQMNASLRQKSLSLVHQALVHQVEVVMTVIIHLIKFHATHRLQTRASAPTH